MKLRSFLLASVAGVLTLAIAVPASAAPGDTTATLTVTGGSLSISVPTSANLGSLANSENGGTVSGALGQVQVLDARTAAAGSGWTASVISTTFVPTPTGTAIAASAVSYTAGPITETGTSVTTANDPGNLTGVSAAVTASAITGDNSASWNPTIHVAMPGGISGASTTYTATITHSVA